MVLSNLQQFALDEGTTNL